MRHHRPAPVSTGFSLIELMIALVIGLALVGGVGSLTLNATRGHKELEQAGEQIENGRYALYIMANDIEHAGYTGSYNQSEGQYLSPCSSIPPVTGIVSPVTYCTNTNPKRLIISRASSSIACDHIWNTTSNTCVARANCGSLNALLTYLQALPSNFKLDTNCSTMPCAALTLKKPGVGDCPAEIREYRVISYSLDSNTLYRQMLSRTQSGGAVQNRESMVDGIKSLSIQFGRDTSGDGKIESYEDATATNGSDAVAVRLTLVTPADCSESDPNKPCRSFSRVVHLPNVAHRRHP